MIAGEIIVNEGPIVAALERFGANAPKALDKVLKVTGYRYRAFVRKSYLSGQMLNAETGQLRDSIIVARKRGRTHSFIIGGRKKVDKQDLGGVVLRRTNSEGIKLANIYEHQGGYVIVPKNRKALIVPVARGFAGAMGPSAGGVFFAKRVEGHARPFMSASAAAFPWAATIEKTAEAYYEKALREMVERGKPTREWSEVDGIAGGKA
jgi:hypothetical protein